MESSVALPRQERNQLWHYLRHLSTAANQLSISHPAKAGDYQDLFQRFPGIKLWTPPPEIRAKPICKTTTFGPRRVANFPAH
jgi:hypothetical protein